MTIIQHLLCARCCMRCRCSSEQNRQVPALIKPLFYNCLEIKGLLFKGMRSKEWQPNADTAYGWAHCTPLKWRLLLSTIITSLYVNNNFIIIIIINTWRYFLLNFSCPGSSTWNDFEQDLGQLELTLDCGRAAANWEALGNSLDFSKSQFAHL